VPGIAQGAGSEVGWAIYIYGSRSPRIPGLSTW
jgi:hypothetical protein